MPRCQSVPAPPLDALLRFEELAMNAWPAAVVQSIDGWRHRHTEGVSRRANSVWPDQPLGDVPLARRIESAEAFYAARGADACFHVSPGARPGGLDAALAERGYVQNGATWLQTASVDEVIAALEPSPDIVIEEAPGPAWERVAWPEPSLRPDVRRAILGRVGPDLACALARVQGEPAAVGGSVTERGHVGIICMRTDPRFRRRGLAAAILRALVQHASDRKAHTAWLQVETDSDDAGRLYRRAGFTTMYGYHYRSRKLAP